MAIDMKKGNQYIRSKGGNKWAYIRVDSTGSIVNADTWHDGVYREKSVFTFEKPEVMIYDEAGNQVASTYDNVNTSIVITSLQDDVDLENFLAKETEDNYFGILMASGDNTDSENKVRYIPVARIATKYSVDAPGRRPDITIIPQYNEYEKACPSKPAWVTSTAVTASAGGYYCVVSQSGANIL